MEFDPTLVPAVNNYSIASKRGVRPLIEGIAAPSLISLPRDCPAFDGVYRPNKQPFYTATNYWSCDSVSGSVLSPEIGSVTATLTSITQYTGGKFDYYLKGTTGGSKATLSATVYPKSFALWYNRDTNTENANICESALHTHWLHITRDTDSPANNLRYYNGSYTSWTGATVPGTGIWFHLVFVESATTDLWYAYINGVRTSGTIDVGSTFRINSWGASSASFRRTNNMTNMQIFASKLTDDQVLELYKDEQSYYKKLAIVDANDDQYPIEIINWQKGPEPVSRWDFDNIVGSTLEDVVGSDDGTITNMTPTVGGPFDNYLAGGSILATRNVDFGTGGLAFKSISLWFRKIIASGSSNFLCESTTTDYACYFWTTDTLYLVGSATNHTVTDTDWHHIVIVEGSSATQHWVYLDGVKSSAEYNASFGNALRYLSTSQTASGQYVADITNVQVFDFIPTDAQIAMLYNATDQYVQNKAGLKILPTFEPDVDTALSLVWDVTQDDNIPYVANTSKDSFDYDKGVGSDVTEGWQNATARWVIPSASLAPCSSFTVRLSHVSANWAIVGCYVGLSDSGGNTYDMQSGTITQVFFNGDGSPTITSTNNESDLIIFDYDGTEDLVVSLGTATDAYTLPKRGSVGLSTYYTSGVADIATPDVSLSTQTNLYMFRGVKSFNAAAGVWPSTHKSVFHFVQDPSDGTDALLDSTSNENHGTPVGTMLEEDLVHGFVGQGWDLDGTDDGVTTASALGLIAYPFATIHYFEVDNLTTVQTLLSGDDATNYIGLTVNIGTSGEVIIRLGDGTGVTSADHYTWVSADDLIEAGRDRVLIVKFIDFTTVSLYIDGYPVAVTFDSGTGASADLTNALYRVGTSLADSTFFDGKIYHQNTYSGTMSDDMARIISRSEVNDIWDYDVPTEGKIPYEINVVIPARTETLTDFPVSLYLNDRCSTVDFNCNEIFDTLKPQLISPLPPVNHWTCDRTSLTLAEASDDFTGTDGDAPDVLKWELLYDNGGGTFDIQDGAFEASFTATGSLGYSTKYALTGDFDIQIDCILETAPSTNVWNMVFQVWADDDNRAYIVSTLSGATKYFASNIVVAGVSDASSTAHTHHTSQKMRITRVGATLITYFWNGSSWTTEGSNTGFTTNDVYIQLLPSVSVTMTFKAAYDNLVINSADSIVMLSDEKQAVSGTITNMTPTVGGPFDRYLAGGDVTSTIRNIDFTSVSFKAISIWINRITLTKYSQIIEGTGSSKGVFIASSGDGNANKVYIYDGSAANIGTLTIPNTDDTHIMIVEGSDSDAHWVWVNGVKESSELTSNFSGVFRYVGRSTTDATVEAVSTTNIQVFDFKLTDAQIAELYDTKPWSKLVVKDGDTQLYTEVEFWEDANRKSKLNIKASPSTADKVISINYDPSNTDQTVPLLEDISDDFTGTDGDAPDVRKWELYDSGGSADIQSNALEFSFTAAGTRDYRSRYQLSGDFDIQIDVDVSSAPSTNIWAFRLGVSVDDISVASDDRAYVGLLYNSGAKTYQGHVESGGTYTSDGTTSASGVSTTKFRITRSSSTLTVYYWNGSSWTSYVNRTDFTSSDLYVLMELYVSTTMTITAIFDNFTVNSADRITNAGYIGPVQSIPGMKVWNSDIKGRWGMNEDPSGTAPQLLDSTGNGRNMTSAGSMTSGDLLTDERGENYIEFDNTDDRFTLADNEDFSSPSLGFSLLVRARHNDIASLSGGIAKGSVFGSAVNYEWKLDFHSGTARFGLSNGASARSATGGVTITTPTDWITWHGTWNGDDLILYRDGEIYSSNLSGGAFSIQDSSHNFVIGCTTGTYPFDGDISVVMFKHGGDSQEWVRTTHFLLNDHLLKIYTADAPIIIIDDVITEYVKPTNMFSGFPYRNTTNMLLPRQDKINKLLIPRYPTFSGS